MDITKPWKKQFFKVTPMLDENGKPIPSNVVVPMSSFWRKPTYERDNKETDEQGIR